MKLLEKLFHIVMVVMFAHFASGAVTHGQYGDAAYWALLVVGYIGLEIADAIRS